MLISLIIQILLQINMKNTNNTDRKNGKAYTGNSQKKYKMFNFTRDHNIAN